MPADSAQTVTPPAASLDREPTGAVLRLSGAWRLAGLTAIDRQLTALKLPAELAIDGAAVTDIDTASALLLLNHLKSAGVDVQRLPLAGFAANEARIVDQVRKRLDEVNTPWPHRQEGLLARIGRETISIIRLLTGHLNFLGETLAQMFRSLVAPTTIRGRELTAQFEQVCLNAIPVVALVTLLIGVVVAYLLGLQAE
jgi:phospholipid/cholesterol/gamma-HCH transport system permease protein